MELLNVTRFQTAFVRQQVEKFQQVKSAVIFSEEVHKLQVELSVFLVSAYDS